MKPYKVTLEIKTKWSLEVHGNDGDEAQTTAESLGFGAIEMGGDFEKVVSIEAVDVELLEPEEDEDDVVEVPEQPDIFEEIDSDHVGRKASEQEFTDMDNLAEGEPAPEEDNDDQPTQS